MSRKDVTDIMVLKAYKEFGMNPAGPPAKPKYYLVTDSELVP